jgi:hypothetical protein
LALLENLIPANLIDGNQRSGRPDGRQLGRDYPMKASCHSRALSRIFLATAFGLSLFAGGAHAQKPGGSITVGLELDISGFDPVEGRRL